MYSFDIYENIKCTMFGRMKQTKGWEDTNKRKNDNNLIVIVTGGTASFFTENGNYSVSAGDILIIPADTYYSALTEDFCEYFFFHFQGKIIKTEKIADFEENDNVSSFDLPEFKDENIYFELKISDESAYRKICKSIIKCTEYNSCRTRSGRFFIDCEFKKILIFLDEVYEKKDCKYPVLLEKAIFFINKNLTEHISLKDVSGYCVMSESYLSRLFRKYMNMTVTEYINSCKLYYACSLIENTSMNISEIADYLGYCDVFYFSKLFKKKFGKSPSTY